MDLGTEFQQKTVSRVDAAKYLGVSVASLARWASKKKGPSYYIIGANARYRLSDLDEFIETKRHESASAS